MIEREWREASDMRSSTWGVGLVLACAAWLRFWNLSHGLPNAAGADEGELINRAVHIMKSGDFNLHSFPHPALYVYVQLLVACVRFIAGASAGLWTTLDQVGPSDFYVWGRAATALVGTLTPLVVYFAGMRWGSRHALLAAGLLAVMPLHVQESHYVVTEVPMTFFTTLAFLLALRAHERETTAAFAWAGIASGLAAATHYSGAVSMIAPLAAAYAMSQAPRTRLSRSLAAAAGFAGAFLIASPFTMIDLPGFLNGLAQFVARPGESGWLSGLGHLRRTMAWPGMLLAVVGFVLAVMRAFTGPGHTRSAMLVLLPLMYLLGTRGPADGRWVLPILPFACLLAAIAVVSGVSLLRRFSIPRPVRTALITAGTIAALLPPAVAAVETDMRLGRQSTERVDRLDN